MNKVKTTVEIKDLDETITIKRKELMCFVSAFGNKVQAHEAHVAKSVIACNESVIEKDTTSKHDEAIECAFDVVLDDDALSKVKNFLEDRIQRHEYCARIVAECLPDELKDIVTGYAI